MSGKKDLLRGELRRKRSTQTHEEIQAASQVINARALVLIDWDKTRYLSCYQAMPREVDTSLILAEAAKRGVLVTIPDKTWQQPSPEDLEISYDVIIVPMLGFDEKCHRIGYGGGYYDRLLAVQPKARKIGLCFELGRVQKLPIESHDAPLDVIITEVSIDREVPDKLV
jgi:5-formyltetrahydrofolate cyclo-ligase